MDNSKEWLKAETAKLAELTATEMLHKQVRLKQEVLALAQLKVDLEKEDPEFRDWYLRQSAESLASRSIENAKGRTNEGGYDAEAFALSVTDSYIKAKASEQAKKLLEAEKTTSGYKALDIQGLDRLLSVPDEPVQWRIKGLMQIGHNATMAARYKVGKTTMVTNMLKVLVDGGYFLDEFYVQQVTRPVVVFNHELSDRQFTAWLRKAGIVNTHMIIPVNLRGKGLYLQDEEAADWAIEILKKYDAEVWIIDPLQAALRGTVNDDMVASEWISAADRVKAESGVSELFLVTHTGHLSKADENGVSTNERSAGSARWSGWPDVLWTYTMDGEGIRYLSAEGRDISISERAMKFDEKTGKLTSQGDKSGRVDNKYNKPYQDLMALLKANPDKTYSRTDLTGELRKPNKFITDAIRDATACNMVEEVELEREPGKRGAAPKGYRLTPIAKTLHKIKAVA